MKTFNGKIFCLLLLICSLIPLEYAINQTATWKIALISSSLTFHDAYVHHRYDDKADKLDIYVTVMGETLKARILRQANLSAPADNFVVLRLSYPGASMNLVPLRSQIMSDIKAIQEGNAPSRPVTGVTDHGIAYFAPEIPLLLLELTAILGGGISLILAAVGMNKESALMTGAIATLLILGYCSASGQKSVDFDRAKSTFEIAAPAKPTK